MLAKKYRLAIQNLPPKALRIFKTPYFSAKIYPADKPFGRFGIIIGKKFDKKAVTRNLWRRRIFSVFEKWPKEEIKSKDLLLIIYPELKKLNYSELNDELEKFK
jgi:ribonuclease P protein component